MKNIKTAERNKLTETHLAEILWIYNTSFEANIEKIIAGRQSMKYINWLEVIVIYYFFS